MAVAYALMLPLSSITRSNIVFFNLSIQTWCCHFPSSVAEECVKHIRFVWPVNEAAAESYIGTTDFKRKAQQSVKERTRRVWTTAAAKFFAAKFLHCCETMRRLQVICYNPRYESVMATWTELRRDWVCTSLRRCVARGQGGMSPKIFSISNYFVLWEAVD